MITHSNSFVKILNENKQKQTKGEQTMQTNTNKDIKRAIGGKGLKQWQVAEALGMSEATFYRKMRKELPDRKSVV